MIILATAMAVGNAVMLHLQPPDAAERWRVLRLGTDAFAGQNTPGAWLVHDGTDTTVVDARGLVNGTRFFYRAFYLVGATWLESATVSVTPEATFDDITVDVLQFVRDRLDYGLQVEVARKTLSPGNKTVPVLVAPPVFEDTRLPIVTVFLQSESSAVRAIGESIASDVAGVPNFDGWRANVQLTITGWTQNPDERIALRMAIRRIIVANLPVFESYGMVQVEFQQQDSDDFEKWSSPMHMTVGTFSCNAPVAVFGGRPTVLRDVVSTQIFL